MNTNRERRQPDDGQSPIYSPALNISAAIRVLLVDDHPVVRCGLRALLASEPAIRVIGEAADGCEAVSLAIEIVPDVVVMDLKMPRMNGLDATRDIVRMVPTARVLVLSSFIEREMVGRVLRAGAAGYLLKEACANDLLNGIREVHTGNLFLGPVAARLLDVPFAEALLARDIGTRFHELTARELEVLQLVAEGFPNKRIAYDLGISVKTVEKHRGKLMRKLNIREVAGLTRYAVANGFVAGQRFGSAKHLN